MYGEFVPVLEEEEGILAFERRTQDRAVKVIANFGEAAKKIPLTDSPKYQILLSNNDHININPFLSELNICFLNFALFL